MRPSLRQDDFDTEKKVILEEIAKYDDQPPYGANEKCMAAFFGAASAGPAACWARPAASAAWPATRCWPTSSSATARGTWSSPPPATSIGTRCSARPSEHCGRWQAFDAPRALPPVEPQQAWQVIHKPQATQQYVMQLAAGPAAEDDDRYAARLLATIVGDDSGSRLFWELVDTGLAETAAIGAHEFQRAGVFMTVSGLCSRADGREPGRASHDVLADVEAEGVTAEELLQAQNKICAHIVPAGRAADQPHVRRRQRLDPAAAIQDGPRSGRGLPRPSRWPTSPPCSKKYPLDRTRHRRRRPADGTRPRRAPSSGESSPKHSAGLNRAHSRGGERQRQESSSSCPQNRPNISVTAQPLTDITICLPTTCSDLASRRSR